VAATQVHRPSSAAHVETMLRRHAYLAFGDRPISTIRLSDPLVALRADQATRKIRRQVVPLLVEAMTAFASTVPPRHLAAQRLGADEPACKPESVLTAREPGAIARGAPLSCWYTVGQRWSPLAVCGRPADNLRTPRDQLGRPLWTFGRV
jgi:hypothetical protein